MTPQSRESRITPPQIDSAAAGQDDGEKGLHCGNLAGHQVAEGHFLSQRQPRHSLQKPPQSVRCSRLTARRPKPSAFIGMEAFSFESVII